MDRVVEDLVEAARPVRRERVDVEVGPAEPVGHRGRGVPSMSGQIGKKTAHHCSGAVAIIRSNARGQRGQRRR